MKTLVVNSALLLLAPLASAQTWTQLFPATSPFGVFAHDMVHDIARGRTVLYGGFGYFTSSPDMYEFDGSTWTLLLLNPNPGDRDSHVMTYDPVRQVTILWGGWRGDLFSPRTWLDDTWEYDGASWRKNNTRNRPPQWLSGRLVFDVGRQRAVWFGGYEHATAQVHNETWEYDGNDWTRVITPTTPPPRAHQALAYDAARGVVVMFGGWVPNSPPLGDTWEYDGTDWTQVTTATNPAPRYGFDGSYDVVRGVTVIHGGSNGSGPSSDTWEFDGVDWALATTTGPASSQHAQVYDSTRGKTLLWGGFDGAATLTNATWSYQGAGVASWAGYGNGCGGSDWYELFTGVGRFDLGGTSIRIAANRNGTVTVSPGGAFDPNFANVLRSGDDQLFRALPLGFTTTIPGIGPVSTVDIDSNGRFGWDLIDSVFSESVSSFLTHRMVGVLWDDLDPSTGGALCFDTFPGKAVITWDSVPQYGNNDSNTFQAQILQGGDMILSWVQATDDGLVGVSNGASSPDPGPTDISRSMPFSTTGGRPLSLAAVTRPVLGTSFDTLTTAIPATSSFGVVLTGFGRANQMVPGLPRGCTLLTTNDFVTFPLDVVTGRMFVPLPGIAALSGRHVYFQSVVVDAALPSPIPVLLSNGVDGLLGSF